MAKPVSVTIDVWPDEVLDDMSDEDLIKELEARKITSPHMEALEEIRHLLMRGRPQEALTRLERLMFPRKGIDLIYAKAKEHRDPATGRPVI